MGTLERDLGPDAASGLPPPVLEQSRLGRLTVALFAVTVLALGGVTVWAVTTRESGPSVPAEGSEAAWRPATAETIRRVDATLAAYNSGDIDTFGAMFREDGVFEEPQSATAPTQGIVGREAIVKAMKYLWTMGARYHRIGVVAQIGNTVAFAVKCETCPGFVGEVDVILFDDAGLIVHYWTIVR